MVGGLIAFWNAWAIQFLVLGSLTLQIVLLLLAGIRRRVAPWKLLTLFLWLAYQLGDVAAIYALGHLSVDGTPREHRLVAFWAPFLLLHLGGPDNITAYALEDNKLWLRHLLNLGLQVMGAAYILYKNFIGTVDLLQLAAILMSVVGLVKYLERTCALKRGNMGRIRSSLKSGTMDSIRSSLKKGPRPRCHFYLEDKPPQGRFKGKVDDDEEEFLTRHAHSLFHICKSAMVESSEDIDPDSPEITVLNHLTYVQKYVLMELELSLMYDILYTKAAVVHTLTGYCICVVSVAATAAAFLLFQFSGKDGHRRIDVAVTYVLLGGALLLETRSLLSALGSSWTLPFLCTTRWNWLQHEVLCAGRWDRLRRWVVSLHRLVNVMGLRRYLRSARRWSGSGTVGQYNMLQRFSPPGKRKTPWNILLGRLCKMLGCEEWWEKEYHSRTVEIPEDVKERLSGYIQALVDADGVNSQGIVRNRWGKKALKTIDLYYPLKDYLGVEFQESIIIWHIATDVFLHGSSWKAKAELTKDEKFQVKAVRLLSNYMMFLLVKRPYMLPGLSQSRLYRKTCQNLLKIWCDDDERSGPSSISSNAAATDLDKNLFRRRSSSSLPEREELAAILLKWDKKATTEIPRVPYAAKVANELIRNDQNVNRAQA